MIQLQIQNPTTVSRDGFETKSLISQEGRIEGGNFQPCNPFVLSKVKTWNTIATLSLLNDAQAMRSIHDFHLDAVLIDGLFFGAAFVAKLLKAPLLIVIPTLIPPLEEVFFGIEEPASEVGFYSVHSGSDSCLMALIPHRT